ncbi:ADP-ribosylation factor-like protein, putative [Trypanosoma equiperdum]|uniref:ADP-ribosylation factor-like protein, putative n=4 Tax=Trypanozoon TaxID=39700 RepID=Q38EM1_TRYB2|nr:ADP-ribosylation factor, putative [Trypanosoma brucei gambiense DAL972]XP_827079.1 ADP-ribosylation factor-like protein, putative [Trypanosoma brucei brucei TREU927]RHW70539.1 ADP-ribosylation factor-like protein [Trypanosoma brucei equiperdum]SCU64972.1 ADP-ribosylation factor-like protein, putative [Trypanosoma equiperdum]EAN76749.1 ADP-ribosylation factor-like protein, putative [Trypanosoma brucei brucei TREU927]CBH14316.1 ADP-ribosylation factor, putative [Trypanosoma brucei gambiense D|eukprot:XP_011776586.1 ADP-ribosylation factor, putative [Trypanosoma brucei gambiense DAL972]
MGQLISGLWSVFNPNRHYKLLILGLNNAGKTSILYHLQLGHSIATQPTLGGNVEQLSISHGSNNNKIEVSCWDLGGQEQLRDSWRLYYDQTDAVIFVVDAADPSRFPAARSVLHKILANEPQLRQAVLLVLANKQDMEGAVSPADLIESLGLAAVNDRTWTLMGCSASKGDSLREAMSWIAQRIGDRRPASSA